MCVSSSASCLYKTRNGSASTTGGRMSWLMKKNEMSALRMRPEPVAEARQPVAGERAQRPPRAPTTLTGHDDEFVNGVRNSSRTVLRGPIVSGDRPSDRQPSHAGCEVHERDQVALHHVRRPS